MKYLLSNINISTSFDQFGNNPFYEKASFFLITDTRDKAFDFKMNLFFEEGMMKKICLVLNKKLYLMDGKKNDGFFESVKLSFASPATIKVELEMYLTIHSPISIDTNENYIMFLNDKDLDPRIKMALLERVMEDGKN